jgi:hypothetical protein
MRTAETGDAKVVQAGSETDEKRAREMLDAAARGHRVYTSVNGSDAVLKSVTRVQGLADLT